MDHGDERRVLDPHKASPTSLHLRVSSCDSLDALTTHRAVCEVEGRCSGASFAADAIARVLSFSVHARWRLRCGPLSMAASNPLVKQVVATALHRPLPPPCCPPPTPLTPPSSCCPLPCPQARTLPPRVLGGLHIGFMGLEKLHPFDSKVPPPPPPPTAAPTLFQPDLTLAIPPSSISVCGHQEVRQDLRRPGLRGLLTPASIYQPHPPSDAQLLSVHPQSYLDSSTPRPPSRV